MPVLHIQKQKQLLSELESRYYNLKTVFEKRDLLYPTEGAGGKRWAEPSKMCATLGNAIEISLAVEDFKAILAEIKKLK